MSPSSERPDPRAEEPEGHAPEAQPVDEESTETPFDHPLFLPAVLLALTLWFGYDGFINQDPDMLEHLTFNRGGFAVLLVLTLWFGWKGLKEFQEEREGRQRDDGPPPPIT